MSAELLPSEQNSQRKVCPACGREEAYSLGDGRLKCKKCRTKYMPFEKNGRLKPEKVRGILEHFWRMTPTDQAAYSLALNRKTVQKYFRLIRELIAEEGEKRLALQMDSIDFKGFYIGEINARQKDNEPSATVPVFGLSRLHDAVCLVFPNGLRDWSKLNLKSVRYVPVNKESILNGEAHAPVKAVEFWQFARVQLKHYRGASKKRLPVFLREMEFRFNHRQDSKVMERLFSLMNVGPR